MEILKGNAIHMYPCRTSSTKQQRREKIHGNKHTVHY